MNIHLGVVRGVAINFLYDPHDLWIGVYRKRFWEAGALRLRLYVLPLPMVGLIFEWTTYGRREGDE